MCSMGVDRRVAEQLRLIELNVLSASQVPQALAQVLALNGCVAKVIWGVCGQGCVDTVWTDSR